MMGPNVGYPSDDQYRMHPDTGMLDLDAPHLYQITSEQRRMLERMALSRAEQEMRRVYPPLLRHQR